MTDDGCIYPEDLDPLPEAMDDGDALLKAAIAYGYAATEEGVEEMLDAYSTDAIVPGVCVFCGKVTEVDRNKEEGICSFCSTNGVYSSLILGDVI